MKPRWKSVWITPAASGAVAPDRDRPGAGLLRPGGQVRLQAEGAEADPDELVQARLVLADRGEQLGGVGGRQVDQLRLDLGVQEDRLGRGDQRPQRVQRGRRRPAPSSSTLKTYRNGLVVSRDSSRSGSRSTPAEDSVRPLSKMDRALWTAASTGARSLLQPGLLLQPGQRLVDGLQVGQDQLGVDRLDVVLAARPGPRRAPRPGRRRRGSPGRSRRPRGCWRGTCCPGPAPSLAPRTMPGDVDEATPSPARPSRAGRARPARRSRASGTPTTPTFGSIVANG